MDRLNWNKHITENVYINNTVSVGIDIMQCEECGKWNEETAKFCKECGCKLINAQKKTDDISPETHAKIGELIYSAHKYRDEGDIEQAILSCGGALALNEKNAPTHIFLGSLYEKRGDLRAAVREYKRALELDPSNKTAKEELDKITIGERKSILESAQIKQHLKNARPYFPLAAATAVLTLVLIAGLYLSYSYSEIRRIQKINSLAKESSSGTQIVKPIYSTPQSPYSQPPTPSAILPANNQPDEQPVNNAPVQINLAKPKIVKTTQEKQGILPIPLPEPLEPLHVENVNQATETIPIIIPIIEPLGTNDTSVGPDNSYEKSSGVISITPSETIKPTTPEDSEEKAAKLHRSGQYEEAIKEYKKLLDQTNNTGRIYQQMALCNTRLGQNDEAIKNYKSAIESYRKRMGTERDKATIERSISSCEAGIKTLQGFKN